MNDEMDKARAWDAIAEKNAEIARLRAENERLRAALDRLRTAFKNREISGSLWDKDQDCHITLPVFFERVGIA